jgi:hypothetical protein
MVGGIPSEREVGVVEIDPTAFEGIAFPDQPMSTDLSDCARKTRFSSIELFMTA